MRGREREPSVQERSSGEKRDATDPIRVTLQLWIVPQHSLDGETWGNTNME